MQESLKVIAIKDLDKHNPNQDIDVKTDIPLQKKG